MDGKRDNNNNDNKAANNDSSLEEFSKDNDNVQFILFKLQVVLANSWFLGGSLYVHKTKVSDTHTTPPLIIMSMSASQNSLGVNFATVTPTKKKKSQKPKILDTPLTKEAVAKAKYSIVNDFVDDLTNIMDSIFLSNIKDQTKYKNCALAYYYHLSLIFHSLNQAELDILFFISLPFFIADTTKIVKRL